MAPTLARAAKLFLIAAGALGILGGVSCAIAFGIMASESARGGAPNYGWAVPGGIGIYALGAALLALIVAGVLLLVARMRRGR